MLQRIREHYTLVLLILLPFHALLVTVLTRVLVGRFQDTPLWLTMWKEVALLLLLAFVVYEILQNRTLRKNIWKLDTLDCVIISTCILGVLVSLYLGITLRQLVFGVKYDLWPLVLLFILRRVPWSQYLQQAIGKVLLGVGILIAIVGIIFMLVPAEVLEWLGYSETHSLFMAHKPVAAFQQIGSSAIRRLQSTFSGPNQAGIWLLIPLGFVWAWLVSRIPKTFSFKGMYQFKCTHIGTNLIALIVLIAIFFTFSRSVWIASLVVYCTGLFTVARYTYAKNIATGTVLTLAIVALIGSQLFPHIIKRDLSSKGHLEKPLEAIAIMLKNPLGLGLGSAGPASNHLSDSCTIVDVGSDISWADPYPELCIFAGDVQLKPANRTCSCAVVTENWYLQWGVEMGVLGFALSIGLAILIVIMLSQAATLYSQSVLLAYVGIAVVGLFLHAWEDSSVAYTMAVLLAVALPSTRMKNKE